MLGSMSSHLRVLVGQLEDLTLRDVETRLANWLVKRCPNPQSETPVRIELTMTKRVLAAELGTVSETFSRTLAKFREQKLLVGQRQDGQDIVTAEIERAAASPFGRITQVQLFRSRSQNETESFEPAKPMGASNTPSTSHSRAARYSHHFRRENDARPTAAAPGKCPRWKPAQFRLHPRIQPAFQFPALIGIGAFAFDDGSRCIYGPARDRCAILRWKSVCSRVK